MSNEQKDLLMKSETIIFSTRWLEKDLINLKEIIDRIKKMNKEIIIISNGNSLFPIQMHMAIGAQKIGQTSKGKTYSNFLLLNFK